MTPTSNTPQRITVKLVQASDAVTGICISGADWEAPDMRLLPGDAD